MSETQSLREQMGKRRRQWKKRTKMPFKLRTMIFAGILAVLMALYFISFGTGNPAGVYVSMVCDNISGMFADGLFGLLGVFTGRDLSDKAIPLQRLLTVGPISFILFATTVSLVVSGVVALVWSHVATKRALDDGTSNFVPESHDNDASAMQAGIPDTAKVPQTPEEVYEEAKSRYLSQGMNRAQAENAAKRDVAAFKSRMGIFDMPERMEDISNAAIDDSDDLAAIMADTRIPLT